MADTPLVLPPEVVSRLRALQLELEEGDITQKGYEKKKARILAPYVAENPPRSAPKVSPKPSPRESPRQSCDHGPGFAVGLRQEAIQLALAQKQARGEGGVPAPTKRQSFLTKRLAENVDNQRPSSSYISPTHFTDTPVGSAEDLQRGVTPPGTSPRGSREEITPGDRRVKERAKSLPLGGVEEWPGIVRQEGLAPPPDVTQGESNFGWNTRRSVHMSSVRVKADDGILS